MKLYQDTEKELFYETDYKPIPENLDKLSCTDLVELYNNVKSAFENACVYNSALLQLALFSDLVDIYSERISLFLRFSSSDYLSGLVGSTKYTDIDIAISKAWKAVKDRETMAQAIIEGFTVEQWFTANCK